ncbi:lipase [Raphidocelis subcapitata]|uniref:Lipase n=1 Tax=Raphidocelis subcapitata TaxID=307507 RepID=A0A2V0P6M8_9CHLO|nr:lipase [Raphidocelis subcapitata]|eukprot:GBF95229.1 lipase [Raphidocelis subcapitata]
MARAGFGAGAVLALLCCAATVPSRAADVPPAPGARSRRALLAGTEKQQPWVGIHLYPYNAYDRTSPAGRAPQGARAGGDPDPVPGLASPDAPVINPRDAYPKGGSPKPPKIKSATMEDLVMGQGYPLETYPVETSDGFILRPYRIPFGVKNATKDAGPRPALLLHHGVTLASSSFVVLDPTSSIAFYLADAGFDVWLANTRGNTYSRGNRQYKDTDPGYWSFSIDELALIDLPSQIDFILGKTGQKSLTVVGHSQGCTLPLMLMSERPEYNQKINLLMMLGPVTFIHHIQAPFLKQQAVTKSAQLLADAGIGPFIPNEVTTQLVSGCKLPYDSQWCYDVVNFMFYGPSWFMSSYDFPRVAATWPSTVSVRNLLHWSQMWHGRRGLQMFDFGRACPGSSGSDPKPYSETCNAAKYGQDSPPAYDLSRVTTKAVVLEAETDIMATKEDVAQLMAAWKADVRVHKVIPRAAHMDFVWARAPPMRQDIIDLLWAEVPR